MRLEKAEALAGWFEGVEPGLSEARRGRSEVFALVADDAPVAGVRLEGAGEKQRVLHPVCLAAGAEVDAEQVAALVKEAVAAARKDKVKRIECQVPAERAELMAAGLAAAGFEDEGELVHFSIPLEKLADEDAGTPFFWRTMVEVGPNVAMAMLERVSEEDPHGCEEKGLNPQEELDILLGDPRWKACRNSVQIGYYDGDAGSFVACLVDHEATDARIGYMGLTWRNRNRRLSHWLIERAAMIAHEENATRLLSAGFADDPKLLAMHQHMGFEEIFRASFWERRR